MNGAGVSFLYVAAVWSSEIPLMVVVGAAASFLSFMLWLSWRRSSRWKREAERYRTIFDSVARPLIVADTELRVIEGNHSARHMLGAARHARRSQHLLSLFESSEQISSERVCHRLSEEGEVRFDASLSTENGRKAQLHVELQSVQIGAASRVIAIIDDVTEVHTQTHQYESFLDHLIRNVPVEVTILSPDGHYHYLSSSFIDETRREWLLGKTDFDYCRESGWHVEVALRRRAHRMEAVARRETVHFEEAIEMNGAERRIMWRYSPFVDADGDVSMVLGFGLDVSELAKCRSDLEHAEQEVVKASRLKEALLQNVSHEVRTPLSSIIATAQMLKPDVPDVIRDFLENIEQSGHRLADTLNEMLDLAGLQAENLEIRPEILNLTAEMTELGRAMRTSVERRGLFLSVSTNEAEILVKADHGALYRCVNSLVDNAAKFTSDGGVLLEVSMSGEYAYIRVMDTGVGIGDENQNEVFDAFSQEDSGDDRAFEGIGLGLAVTKRLLSMMDGDIRVYSRKGAGSSFVVRLPLLIPELRRRTDVKPRVMLADSHRETHRMMRHMLGDYFQFESVYSLSDAAALFGQHSFEAVLVDSALHPEFNADELLAAFQGEAPIEAPPFILMDHRRQPRRRKEVRSAGWHDHVSKPLQKLEVMNVLYSQAAMTTLV